MQDYDEARRRHRQRLREADERHLARVATAERRGAGAARRMLGAALMRLGRWVAEPGPAVSPPQGARSKVA